MMVENMLTIFAIPKAFHGHIETIQRNAIQSWRLLRPHVRLILFGTDVGTKEIAHEMDIEHMPNVACSQYGTPLIQDVFHQARELSTTPLLCYINSDIILMPDFMNAARIAAVSKKHFLLCGRRWNLDVVRPLDFSEGWEDRLKKQVKISGKLEEPWAIDYFVFSAKLRINMPPFIIGRPAWDNWFLYSVRLLGVPLIDATSSIMAVHQNHDYRHIPQGTGKTWDGPETDNNIRLAGPLAREFSLRDATHVLVSDRVMLALDRNTLIRKLDMIPQLKPWTAPIIAMIRLLLRITKPFRSLILHTRNKIE